MRTDYKGYKIETNKEGNEFFYKVKKLDGETIIDCEDSFATEEEAIDDAKEATNNFILD